MEPKLIRGGGGVFDIVADGKGVFSKHQMGRFPEPSEIIDALTPG